jgi:hypothetical protein
LRAINEEKPVKETTLQKIADKLRVPLGHLRGPSNPDTRSAVAGGGLQEIKLEQLDATALRGIASDVREINWFLKIDQMPEELETLLLKLRKGLHDWVAHEFGMASDPEAPDNLDAEINYIKASVVIDEIVEALAQRKLKIFGATYVVWQRELVKHDPDDEYYGYDPTLRYNSRLVAALSIVPEQKTNITVRVHPGTEPPQQFDEASVGRIQPDINHVEVDGKEVWARDDIPF